MNGGVGLLVDGNDELIENGSRKMLETNVDPKEIPRRQLIVMMDVIHSLTHTSVFPVFPTHISQKQLQFHVYFQQVRKPNMSCWLTSVSTL